MKAMPHQIEGARFLADQRFAILADAPRVGKTGAAIIAADLVMARTILVVTTASGRAVWRKGFADWSVLHPDAKICTPSLLPRGAEAVIVGWPSIAEPGLQVALAEREWDVVILDEGHYAKSFDAKRTCAAFGQPNGRELSLRTAVVRNAKRVWVLTGTPMPNSPFDLFPMLRFGAADRLAADEARGWPDVMSADTFLKRYCETRPKKIGPWRSITVITGGKNLDELRARIDGLMLRRTQQDVGITAPIYETFPLIVPASARREADKVAASILDAIDAGNTRELEMHLGPLRRVTGAIKAKAVIEAVKEEFDCGLDKIVLAFWHREVAEALMAGLAQYGVVGIDGATPPTAREANVAAFSRPDGPRVFLAQIQAAGEAIDLSAAAELMFVEMSFVPKDGAQMALRVTNHTQTRQPRVRVASIAGSIDDAIQASLLRKVQTIQEVLK